MKFLIATMILLTKPKIITGTENLLNTVLPWLIALVAIVAGVAIAFQGLMYMQESEEERGVRKKKMKSIMYTAIIIVGIAGSINFVLSFYQ